MVVNKDNGLSKYVVLNESIIAHWSVAEFWLIR